MGSLGVLIAGLVVFLGVHSVRVVAEGWRNRMRARIGAGPWKGVYALLSIMGFVLICWGYSIARQQPVVLWTSPTWTRHLAALLTLPVFVLLVAAYVPHNAFKARLHHPMVLAVKLWALAHLLANNTLADLLLFGGFLLWAALDFRAARQRDRATLAVYAQGHTGPTLVVLGVGLLAWVATAFWAHAHLIGVAPFGFTL